MFGEAFHPKTKNPIDRMFPKATIKHFVFSALTALSPSNPHKGPGNAGDVAGAVQDFVADLGVDVSVERQLLGIERIINEELVDLGPYYARLHVGSMPSAILESKADCSIYDAKPSDEQASRSGALVFVKRYRHYDGVVTDPSVQLIGFGATESEAWEQATRSPAISNGKAGFERETSYMLWYQFRAGEIVSRKIPYPFYMAIVR